MNAKKDRPPFFVRVRDAAADLVLAVAFLSLVLALVPKISAADSSVGGLVPCGTGAVNTATGDVTNACGFSDFMTLVSNITNYLIVIGASVAALVFAYAGWLYMSAGGSAEQANKAKRIFGKVVLGFVIMLAAWLVVHAAYCSLVDQSAEKGFFSYVGICSQ